MTYTRLNSSAATLTKNRTEDSISPFSGMCTTCIDGCVRMGEIGKAASRGPEMIYPQPFGIITTASAKSYPVDLSHFTILAHFLITRIQKQIDDLTQRTIPPLFQFFIQLLGSLTDRTG